MQEKAPDEPRIGDVYVYPGLSCRYVLASVEPDADTQSKQMRAYVINQDGSLYSNAPEGCIGPIRLHKGHWARRATREECALVGLPYQEEMPLVEDESSWVSFCKRR